MILGSFLSTNMTVIGPLAGGFLNTARKLMAHRSSLPLRASSRFVGCAVSHFSSPSPSTAGMESDTTQTLPPWLLATAALGSAADFVASLAVFFAAALAVVAANNATATSQIFMRISFRPAKPRQRIHYC